MEVSKLHPYSVGYVGENKDLNSMYVEVTPIEQMQLFDGELSSIPSTFDTDILDGEGNKKSVSVTTANTIKCKWLPLGESNRMTAPDVRRGELVWIYRLADSDKYFWVTLSDDITHRKLETVVWAFSATQDENGGSNKDNYYFFEVSTHRGLIKLHTSTANKELCGYDIEINGADGMLKIVDSIGNYVVISSMEKRIRFQNAAGSYMDFNKSILECFTADSINFKTNNYNVDATTAVNLKTNTTTIDAPTTHLTGKSVTDGMIDGKGGINVIGGGSLS